MIVRIMGEGQVEITDDHLDELNAFDDRLESAVDAGDEERFREALDELLTAVRRLGAPVPDEALVDSDLVLPFAEAHIDDVRSLLADSDGGLIPG